MRLTGGVWLFTTGALYVELVIIDMLAGEPVPTEILQLSWILIMSLPLFVPPLARFFNVNSITQT